MSEKKQDKLEKNLDKCCNVKGDELRCPFDIPEDECCEEPLCPVWKNRIKKEEKKLDWTHAYIQDNKRLEKEKEEQVERFRRNKREGKPK